MFHAVGKLLQAGDMGKKFRKKGLRRAVAQLVEARRYKPEGRRFDSRGCHWNFSLT